jgi:hypothetical protein
MKELEPPTKSKSPTPKVVPPRTRTPSMEQLHTMTTDELVKLLLSPEIARPMNAVLREQIIRILQQREGNAFVQRLLGKASGPKAT